MNIKIEIRRNLKFRTRFYSGVMGLPSSSWRSGSLWRPRHRLLSASTSAFNGRQSSCNFWAADSFLVTLSSVCFMTVSICKPLQYLLKMERKVKWTEVKMESLYMYSGRVGVHSDGSLREDVYLRKQRDTAVGRLFTLYLEWIPNKRVSEYNLVWASVFDLKFEKKIAYRIYVGVYLSQLFYVAHFFLLQ